MTDFFDENLLQYFDFERFLIDHMISSDREALSAGKFRVMRSAALDPARQRG
ncbi:hypothetical protein V3H18_04735 [Methylocystis sp. 9N]|uniref:Uncharacterized protein n=1 Tax=Methylocystis borbori TaxID=3118750 RepID=A0ABU7XEM8_9HYPH